MGLSYLHKKNWHPPNMENVKGVWLAERRVEEAEKKRTEHLKRLKEEKQIEDLKRIQVQQGIIPESSLNMIEWMYQDRAAFNKSEQTAEDYLLGKEVKEGDLQNAEDQKSKLAKVTAAATTQESYSTTENEAFLRMKDDPLVLIKQREMQLRDAQVYNNPMVLRQIKKEIEKLKSDKKKKKKDKKKKKHKSKSKKRKHHSSSSRSSERSHHRRHHSRSSSHHSEKKTDKNFLRPQNRRSEKHEEEKEPRRSSDRKSRDHHRDRSPDRYHSRQQDDRRNYHRHDERSYRNERDHKDKDRRDRREYQERDSKRTNNEKRDLGPDMAIYKNRAAEVELEQKLRMKNTTHQKLTQAEKEAKANEMMEFAKAVDQEKKLKFTAAKQDEGQKSEDEKQPKNAKFLSSMQKNAYLESDITLEDRLNRSKHYQSRQALKE